MMPLTLRATLAVAAGAVLFGGAEHPSIAAAPGETLVLEGTVASIGLAQQADRRRPWSVTISVKKVVTGTFEGRSFTFSVHSPSRNGLERGRSCIVKAVWKDGGYVVDEVATGRLTHHIDTPDGTGPAERDRLIEEEFRAYVAARQECSVDNDCALVPAVCPFGCVNIPVNVAHVDDVARKQAEMHKRLSRTCKYKCPPVTAAVCRGRTMRGCEII